MEQGPSHTFDGLPTRAAAGGLMAGRRADCLAAAAVGDVALSGRACRPPGDESRVAPARLGRHARERHGPAGVCPGDSGGLGRRGGGAAVSRDGGPAGVSLSRGGRDGGPAPRTAGPIVGREQDVARLEGWFERAAHGTRQLVFVSGDAGIGKTTVVDRFLAQCAAGSAGRIGRGQCVEHAGEEEPYLPFFEALWQLGHGPGARHDPGGAAAVCAPVAGAVPGAGERAGARAAPAPGGRGDSGPHAPRTRPGARRADGRRPAGARA